MRISTAIIATLIAASTVLIGIGPASAAPKGCTPVKPAKGYYAGGRVASAPLTVPNSACSTISVSHVRDAQDPGDRCQTFLLAFLNDGGGETYTEPVEACSPGRRTVLASGVPDGAVFRVLYQVDYIEPEIQQVRFTIWR